jgi:hypothetical protein
MNLGPIRTILLAGFQDDIRKLADGTGVVPARLIEVDETATDSVIPVRADIVVYVCSRDTFASSRLHIIFSEIHHRVENGGEYLVALDNVDFEKGVFPELASLRWLPISGLQRLVNGPKAS